MLQITKFIKQYLFTKTTVDFKKVTLDEWNRLVCNQGSQDDIIDEWQSPSGHTCFKLTKDFTIYRFSIHWGIVGEEPHLCNWTLDGSNITDSLSVGKAHITDFYTLKNFNSQQGAIALMKNHIQSTWVNNNIGSGCKLVLRDTHGSVIHEHTYLDIFEIPETIWWLKASECLRNYMNQGDFISLYLN